MPPVPAQRGVERLAQPVDERRLLQLREHVAIDARVVVRIARDSRQLTARHHHDLAAHLFDVFALLLVRGLDIAQIARRARRQVIGLRAAHDAPADRLRLRHRAADELLARLPIETHAALRGVHRLGDAEPVLPDVAPERQRALPIDDGRRGRADVGERIRDDVHRRVWQARAGRRATLGVKETAARGVVVNLAAGARQPDALSHLESHHTIVGL